MQHQNWPIGEKKNAYLKIKYIFLNFMLVIFLQLFFSDGGVEEGELCLTVQNIEPCRGYLAVSTDFIVDSHTLVIVSLLIAVLLN